VFTTEPKSTAVALGSDMVLSCSATALDVGGNKLISASISYTWTVDGHAPPFKALYFFNHSLYVPGMTPADAGRYQCHVALNSSALSSRNATVVIACNNTATVLSRDYNCDSTTIRRYHDAFDYDGSDRNYDLTAIRLRSDYDVSRTSASIRRDSTRAKN